MTNESTVITAVTFGEYHHAVTCIVAALDMATGEAAEEVIEYPQIEKFALDTQTDYPTTITITMDTGAVFTVSSNKVGLGSMKTLIREYIDYYMAN